MNYVSHNIFNYIEHCPAYETAIETQTRLFETPPNEILLGTYLPPGDNSSSETLSKFLRELHKLSKDCNIKAVSAEEYREKLIRDTFIDLLRP